MPDVTWAEIAKLALFILLTWWIRRGSVADNTKAAERVIKSTAAQSTSEDIVARLQRVETDLALVKRATVGGSSIDDRGPKGS